MAWRGPFLATAAAVAILTVAAVAGEELAPTPAPTPAGPALGSESGHWGWGPSTELVIGPMFWVLVTIAPAMLFFFLHGIARCRHDWKPLVLGLFALGVGALVTVRDTINCLDLFLSKGGANPLDIADGMAKGLVSLFLGLVLVLTGGLFTVILRWRNERFRERQAEAAEAKAETEA